MLLAAIISVLSSELIVKFKARESVKVKRIIYESGTFVKWKCKRYDFKEWTFVKVIIVKIMLIFPL